jgi:hypothetical protein
MGLLSMLWFSPMITHQHSGYARRQDEATYHVFRPFPNRGALFELERR